MEYVAVSLAVAVLVVAIVWNVRGKRRERRSGGDYSSQRPVERDDR